MCTQVVRAADRSLARRHQDYGPAEGALCRGTRSVPKKRLFKQKCQFLNRQDTKFKRLGKEFQVNFDKSTSFELNILGKCFVRYNANSLF